MITLRIVKICSERGGVIANMKYHEVFHNQGKTVEKFSDYV